MSQRKEKEMNFELDLLPVISMMSVCICFLLLTAVWTQIGSVNIDQGLGQESSRQDQKSASLWVTMKANGEVTFKMMDAPTVPANLQSQTMTLGVRGSNWAQLEQHAAELKRTLPELKTALIMSDGKVNYGDVIHMMDRLKVLQIGEIGIAPL